MGEISPITWMPPRRALPLRLVFGLPGLVALVAGFAWGMFR